MNWDEKAEAAAQPFGEHRSHDMRFVNGAKWMREQLRTNEATEIAADAIVDASFGQELPEAPIDLARAAITALLGEGK